MHQAVLYAVNQEPCKMTPNLSNCGTDARLADKNDTTKKNTSEQQTKNQPVVHNNYIPLTTKKYEWQIVWRNVFAFIYLHLAGAYGIYLAFTDRKNQTVCFALFYGLIGGYGITAGAHRLWSHRCYKANTGLRIFLAFCNTVAFQNHIYEWSRDHRVHHKFTDTDADPHNSRRGFFFSHIGWLMLKKHPDVKRKGKLVDMSDLEKDWVIVFQRKYYLLLMPVCAFLIPTFVPWYFWDESLNTAFHVTAMTRYTLGLNFTWLVNSAAHVWGNRPYDRAISPTENIYVGILAFGEGWHNYHHTFPWDYRTSEFSGYRTNITTAFIDFLARYGWAYDLKTAKPDMIRIRARRTGDGSHHSIQGGTLDWDDDSHHSIQGGAWGWGDPDITEEDRRVVDVINPKED